MLINFKPSYNVFESLTLNFFSTCGLAEELENGVELQPKSVTSACGSVSLYFV